MRKNHQIVVPAIFIATALAFTVGAGAQTTSPTPPAASTKAAATAGHHKSEAASVRHQAEMRAECQAMMAKKQEMQAKSEAMDASLDKLVADMNAAQASSNVEATQKSMAAVINELVAQRKASRSMMMDMQPEMMAHMKAMHGTKTMMTDCPMMKAGEASDPKPAEKMPKM